MTIRYTKYMKPCLLLLIFFILPSFSYSQSTTAVNSDLLIDRAAELCRTRYLDINRVYESLKILEDIVKAEPSNYRANYELSRVNYVIGAMQKLKNEKLKYFNEGVRYGKKAISISSGSLHCHLWYAVNFGKIHDEKNNVTSVFAISELRREMDFVLHIEPDNTIALLTKAMMFFRLPGFLGGNTGKAIEGIKNVLRIDPDYTIAYLYLGEIYVKKKDYKNAEAVFKKMLEVKKPTYEADFILNDSPAALKHLEELKTK